MADLYSRSLAGVRRPCHSGMGDRPVVRCLSLKDPDGNEVELYVDADEALWKDHPGAVFSPIKPLRL